MGPKFKFGDKVIAGKMYPGTIVSVRKDGSKFYCTVKFDGKNLIPPQMEYEERLVEFKNKNKHVCPVCGTKWNVVKFNMHTWKDCKKCGKKSEDILEEVKSGKSVSKEQNELLIEFEKMLGGTDSYLNPDDDDDDFGFFPPGI